MSDGASSIITLIVKSWHILYSMYGKPQCVAIDKGSTACVMEANNTALR